MQGGIEKALFNTTRTTGVSVQLFVSDNKLIYFAQNKLLLQVKQNRFQSNEEQFAFVR